VLQRQQITYARTPFLVVTAGKERQLGTQVYGEITTIDKQNKGRELEPESKAIEMDMIDGITHGLQA